ncbi:MAG: metallophosphoesterase [Ferruginibacter sp.]|nr:metallophosphoesterase [Ferruginibacter sp.]
MNLKSLLVLILASQIVVSCKKDLNDNEKFSQGAKQGNFKKNDHLKIAIVSDIHYMHPSLLINNGAAGAAFQTYLDQDPKLVQYSDPIFRNVLADIRNERPDIVLVPGDITKDGEKVSHVAVAGFLNQLRGDGVKVYVVPGNHDVNNAKAKIFDGENAYPVEMTSAADFANIYANHGYADAIARDPNSLSYVVEPEPGFRIIGIDASKYEDYGPAGDVAAGRIKPQTLTWILARLAEAKQQNITIFAMMHHNLIEHYAGQSQLDPGYVIDDWENVSHTLMNAGLKIIFTGHYHANDISSQTFNGNTLVDIQTGSLVTAPSPYRLITMKDGKLDVSSKTVQSIDVSLPGGLSFPAYAGTFLSQHLDGYFNYYLTNQLGAPPQLSAIAAPIFRNGIMAHFAGDEKLPPEELAKINDLGTMSQQLASIVTTLWTDTGEKDNKNSIPYK